jgi:general L-amino acid transport system substrate-binding protein
MVVVMACCGARAQSTLEKVRAAGELRCGIDVAEAEYSMSDDHGNREAFDGDLCRAVAAAVLGPEARVVIARYPDDATSVHGLSNSPNGGEVEMVATLTDDLSHSVTGGIRLTRPVLWDGIGFLVLGNKPALRARQLAGKPICFLAESGVEESVQAWFAREHLHLAAYPFSEEGEMDAAFATGNCGALAEDRTRLAETRAKMTEHGRRTTLLPETISKDPLATATREDDAQWSAIVSWVMEALVQAEESGVTRANVSAMQASDDPVVRRLLGGSHEIGAKLGLKDDWVVRVIEATGNYGELYESDLGSKSAMKLPRGENNLSTRGGLMVALPVK